MGILNWQSRAERQNTFDWLHILPVISHILPARVTISQYKSYSANISHILPARVTISQYKPCSANAVALFHETERNLTRPNETWRNRAIIVVKCVTKMYQIHHAEWYCQFPWLEYSLLKQRRSVFTVVCLLSRTSQTQAHVRLILQIYFPSQNYRTNVYHNSTFFFVDFIFHPFFNVFNFISSFMLHCSN